ncbi:FAD/NAD(P)-binding domain-containing protein [Mollisia scopiformis]|uniref:FAD/NAD(P)-binding domain-containing protein n=1 Tax=Mollisia scopiformis TaxID=149040 RepID=A0A194WZS0_MOLSC|nr:FAD/NAD(P)-binding domain-containing protein [Mollisia scopiformis]KUJ13204.1 FAD/NAD(P)-binding domain-containing protein [Mollisia scopiformis]
MPMRILISGAGIAGSTAAWFLAKTGAHITVVEKAPSLLPHGQNVDIKGCTLKVVRKMGLMEEYLRHGTTEKGTQFMDPNGRPYASFPVESVSMTSEYEILRGDLAQILYEATKGYPNITYLFDTTISEVTSNGDDSVEVRLSNGEIQKSDILIAADGQWSKVRKRCFRPEDVSTVDKGMYGVYYTIPRLPSDESWWSIYQALGSRIVSLRPDPHGTMRALLTIMPCNDSQKTAWQAASKSDRQTQEDLLRRDFADAGWQAQRLLDSISEAPDFYFQDVQQIKMSKWSSSRIICLGDTAYAPTPLTGMGTSLAITGAYLLAGELSKLGDDEHPAKAFEAYENMFRPYVESAQQIPFFVPAIAHPETAWKRWLFGAVMGTLAKIFTVPWLARAFKDYEDNEDDFALPEYSIFEEGGSK